MTTAITFSPGSLIPVRNNQKALKKNNQKAGAKDTTGKLFNSVNDTAINFSPVSLVLKKT
jgi:hypothetical protein